MLKLFFLTTLIMCPPINSVNMYNRIPENHVYATVEDFLQKNQINNCFEKQENLNLLQLKCWRNNQLIDVDIHIQPSKKKKQQEEEEKRRNNLFGSLSIYI